MRRDLETPSDVAEKSDAVDKTPHRKSMNPIGRIYHLDAALPP